MAKKYVTCCLNPNRLRTFGNSVIQNPPSAALADPRLLPVCVSPLTSYRLSFVKMTISAMDLRATDSTPKILTVKQISSVAMGNSGLGAAQVPFTGYVSALA